MKHFLVILGLTALVWVGVSLTEEDVYPVDVRVRLQGYDTVRYSVVSADTLLPLQISMTGASAFMNSRRHVGVVDVDVEGSAVAVEDLEPQLQHVFVGARQIRSTVDSLRVRLAVRSSRTYHLCIDDAHFSFADQYGLYGEPIVTPSEVTLYGPEEALRQIDRLRVAPVTIDGIDTSITCRLSLEPVWQQFADVHPSCTEVEVYLPVEAFVEKEYRVPVRVLDADTSVTIRLYPPEVSVHVWVARRDMHRDPEFTVAVGYDEVLRHTGGLTPQLASFPAYMRPRNIVPNQIQAVVIK